MRHRPIEHAGVAAIERFEEQVVLRIALLTLAAPSANEADIIGVSVKLTNSDTNTANAIVNPKLCMKRPTMPLMKPTGAKIATSDNVVAITARPISLVASIAACLGGMPFSSMKRKMFSSTTIASSMTMPTESVSASIVSMLSVKPMYQTSEKVATIDVGMEMAAITVERKLPRNSQTTNAASIEPTIRCSCTLAIDASMNCASSRTMRSA
jgi:hypothetical protein